MGKLDVEVKARVSNETKVALAKLAEEGREGTNVSDIVREAISEYLVRQKALKKKPGKRAA